MPRKHKEPKPRNIEKIKRKREKRKAEKNKLLFDSNYKDIQQSHISHQKQAEFVAAHEYPGLKVEQSKTQKDLWAVISEDGFTVHTYELGAILRKFRLYADRELSKYEMIQEIFEQLRVMPISDVKDFLMQTVKQRAPHKCFI